MLGREHEGGEENQRLQHHDDAARRPVELQAARETAGPTGILTRARAGEDFVALVSEFSDAAESAQGGQLGLRTANRYPPLFLEATDVIDETVPDLILRGLLEIWRRNRPDA